MKSEFLCGQEFLQIFRIKDLVSDGSGSRALGGPESGRRRLFHDLIIIRSKSVLIKIQFFPVLGIRVRIFLDLPDTDPSVGVTNPDQDPSIFS